MAALAPGSADRPMQVMTMDGEANEKPGFLTEEENRALPLIKFFPACGGVDFPTVLREKDACRPRMYPGRPNVQNLIDWIVEATEAEAQAIKEAAATTDDKSTPASPLATLAQSPLAHPLPLDQAHSLAQRIEPVTHAAVSRALVARFQQDSDAMPALKLHEIAPCGRHLNELMRRFMLTSYASYVDDPEADEAAGAELFARYRACTEKEEEKLAEFWDQIKKQTDEALEAIETKKKQKAADQAEKEAAAAAAQATAAPTASSSSSSTTAQAKEAANPAPTASKKATEESQ